MNKTLHCLGLHSVLSVLHELLEDVNHLCIALIHSFNEVSKASGSGSSDHGSVISAKPDKELVKLLLYLLILALSVRPGKERRGGDLH